MKITSFIRRPRERPFGVSVIIFMLILYTLLLAIILFASFTFKVPPGELDLWIMGINNPTIIRVLFVVIAALEISIAVGLWRMQRWAWVLIMIQTGLVMVSDLWGYFHEHPSYISMLISVIIVFYLNQRDIQRAFSGTPRWLRNGRPSPATEV